MISRDRSTTLNWVQRGRVRAFSLAELLVVAGIIALLMALLLPPLQLARHQAMRTHCASQLQQMGAGLESARSTHGFYPYVDDGGSPIRYTWIDVLVQNRFLDTDSVGGKGASSDGESTRARLGYCPEDTLPDVQNVARHQRLIYPVTLERGGIDYSYGIGVPLASGGWAWRAGYSSSRESRRFLGHTRNEAGRVLAGDATTSGIYNLSGSDVGAWNYPTQFDNTIAWRRHYSGSPTQGVANLLFQDGHVSGRAFAFSRPQHPINTSRTFLWHPGESPFVNPTSTFEGQWYPNETPPSALTSPTGNTLPDALVPRWYTQREGWTLISHK